MKGKEQHWVILGALAAAVVLAMILRQLPESSWVSGVVEVCRFVGDLFKQAL